MEEKSIAKQVAASPVIPIPPAYNQSGDIDWTATCNYVKYLQENGANTIMTTAGTSQYNLLSRQEIIELQKYLAANFKGRLIMGLPPVHTAEALSIMHDLRRIREGCHFMALYPDRYYSDENIVEYFHTLADAAEQPMFIHGMFMRHGMGGSYDFTSHLISKVAQHPNIIGMKEETTDYAKAYNVLRKLSVSQDFVTIVAGGSMRRHLLLGNARKDVTFLSGVGNFFPQVEQDFLDFINSGDLKSAVALVKEYEDLLFEDFMKVGWHRALRAGLKSLGPYANTVDRPPFSQLTSDEFCDVAFIVEQLRRKYEE